MSTGAWGPGLRPWQRSRVVGAEPEKECGPASAQEGKCGKDKMVLGDLLPLASFHPWQCLIPQISYESKASFVLCRKKEEVRKERLKILRVAKPHTTLEDLILTPKSSCRNSDCAQWCWFGEIKHCVGAAPRFPSLYFHLTLCWRHKLCDQLLPAFILDSKDLKEYPLAGDSCYSSRKYFFPSLIKFLPYA